MRFAVIQTIYDAALKNKDIYFMTGDLNHVKENEFKTVLCSQYFNAGVAEQNMAGVAAGLALSGKKVFIYSITPFITMRCFEQIKSDICYPNLDVTVIGVGGGLIYGRYGNTHCSIEDIAVMRTLPNMKVVCPANPLDAGTLTKQMLEIKGPAYIRIGRGKEPMPATGFPVKFGQAFIVKPGQDITIISTGTVLTEVEKTAALLEEKGISTEIIHMHTVKPLDENAVRARIKKRRAIFTVEDHNIIGGLGSAVAEVVSENRSVIIFKRFGVRDLYLKEIGSQEYLRKKHGYSSAEMSRQITALI